MSLPCLTCGGASVRHRRSLVERLFVRTVRICERCGSREREFRRPFESAREFLFARHTRCIDCGTSKVRRLSTRDHIDRMSRRPYSMLIALTGAPIYYCSGCRLQYHDWRPPAPETPAEAAADVAG